MAKLASLIDKPLTPSGGPGKPPTYHLQCFSGFSEVVDDEGLSPGFYLVTGPEGVGKTIFSVNLFIDLVESNDNLKCLFFTSKASMENLLNRIYACCTGIDYQVIEDNSVSPHQLKTLTAFREKFKKLYYADRLDILEAKDPGKIGTGIKKELSKNRNLAVFIDDLGTLTTGSSKYTTPVQHLEAMLVEVSVVSAIPIFGSIDWGTEKAAQLTAMMKRHPHLSKGEILLKPEDADGEEPGFSKLTALFHSNRRDAVPKPYQLEINKEKIKVIEPGGDALPSLKGLNALFPEKNDNAALAGEDNKKSVQDDPGKSGDGGNDESDMYLSSLKSVLFPSKEARRNGAAVEFERYEEEVPAGDSPLKSLFADSRPSVHGIPEAQEVGHSFIPGEIEELGISGLDLSGDTASPSGGEGGKGSASFPASQAAPPVITNAPAPIGIKKKLPPGKKIEVDAIEFLDPSQFGVGDVPSRFRTEFPLGNNGTERESQPKKNHPVRKLWLILFLAALLVVIFNKEYFFPWFFVDETETASPVSKKGSKATDETAQPSASVSKSGTSASPPVPGKTPAKEKKETAAAKPEDLLPPTPANVPVKDIVLEDSEILGVSWNKVDRGLKIIRISHGPCSKAGIREGDIILSVNGGPTNAGSVLVKARDEVFLGKRPHVLLEVQRKNKIYRYKLIRNWESPLKKVFPAQRMVKIVKTLSNNTGDKTD